MTPLKPLFQFHRLPDRCFLRGAVMKKWSEWVDTYALHEFPNDIFTNEDRRQGAVVLHVLCAIYMFYALAIVCDDFFVPSLEKICERLHLSEDVAGATFMAAGSSAPELFTSVIGVFITKGDVGVGTIVGSAVFNILCIIGVCGLFAGQVVALSSWCLLRDSIYYTLSVIALIVVSHSVLVLMYLIYIVIMKYNACIHQCFERRTKGSGNMVNGLANNAEIDDSSNCDATVVLLKKANFHRKASVIMVDELLSAYPHQLSFSEAGLRIMITSHFPPKTRLSMASRMLINERQRLINSRAYTNGESDVAIKIPIKHTVENGTGPSSAPDRGVNGTRRDDVVAEAGNETENENEDNENDEEEEEDEDDDEGPYTPFDPPSGKLETVKWAFTWPLSFVLYFTVPNCNKPRWEKWFMVTFASSTLWIAAFSYMMVWMVTIIGYTLGIPDVIMGITFLAAGTSVPDCMASLIVARQGMGDMAVSNSIGSNVFDILIGLGLPWALQTLAVDYGSYVRLRGLCFNSLGRRVFVSGQKRHRNRNTERKTNSPCQRLAGTFRTLEQGSANFFCQGANTKYFRLCGPEDAYTALQLCCCSRKQP
uniref:Solute carrier family 24 member 3 n=1 Tax=Saimiri boliviensis boliviensis TaxID=39432 RepID=A0A2K6U8R8_SAIBB